MTTITAVPESLTRAQFTAWIESVGIDPTQCQSITIDRNGIHATVFALNAEGHRYANPGSDEVATHTLHVRIDDPEPCPRCGEPMHPIPAPSASGSRFVPHVWGHDCQPA